MFIPALATLELAVAELRTVEPAALWCALNELLVRPDPDVRCQASMSLVKETVLFMIDLIRRHLDAGAPLIMIESEGITENVRTWRTGVVSRLAAEFGLERLMFEAADPPVFSWYVKTFGSEVNLFVDRRAEADPRRSVSGAMLGGLWGWLLPGVCSCTWRAEKRYCTAARIGPGRGQGFTTA
jgi:hypothetical protein